MVGIASAVSFGLHGADIDVNAKFLDTGGAVAINAHCVSTHCCGIRTARMAWLWSACPIRVHPSSLPFHAACLSCIALGKQDMG